MSFSSSILVVDDDAMVCTFMKHSLEIGGYRVLTANSGHEAMDVLVTQGHELCLVVTDVLMPGMTGAALAKAVGQLCPGLPVLYVSGYYGNEDQVSTTTCLEKPFTPAELLKRVQALAMPQLVQ